MEITLLGTASATSGIDRDNTSLLVGNNTEFTMIDVSGNPMGKLKNMNISSDQIRNVILTHFHIDHIYGLPSLLWGMWIEKRTKPLTIHCDTGNVSKLKDWLKLIEVDSWPILFEIQINDYNWKSENVLIESEDFELKTFPVSHGIPNSGISIKYQNNHVVYSSDTELNEWIKSKNINVLIHEATTAYSRTIGHTSLIEITEEYNFKNIDKLILVHLTDNEPYEDIISRLPNSKQKKIMLGYDGLKFKI